MSLLSYVADKTGRVLLSVITAATKFSLASTVLFSIYPDVLMNKYVDSKVANLKHWLASLAGCLGLYIFTGLIFGGGTKPIGGYIVDTMVIVSFFMIIFHWIHIRHASKDKDVMAFVDRDTDGYGLPLYLNLKRDFIEVKNKKKLSNYYEKVIRHELFIKPGVIAVVVVLSINESRYLVISGGIFIVTLWKGLFREKKIRKYLRIHENMDEEASEETIYRTTGSSKNDL